MNVEELTRKYWKHYLMLEGQFMDSLKYVELYQKHFQTFSNEYAHLLQTIGGELDTFFKEFCGFDTEDQKNIENYRKHILKSNPDIVNQIILLQGYEIRIQPFKNWDSEQLKWWRAFAAVKHNRYNKRSLANQWNVLNILGALYMLEMMYLKKITESNPIDIFDESSKLFKLANWHTRATKIGNNEYIIPVSSYRPASQKSIDWLKNGEFSEKKIKWGFTENIVNSARFMHNKAAEP